MDEVGLPEGFVPPSAALAPPPVIVTVSLGEPETGVWCPHCLLPSAVRWPIVADMPRLFPAGLSVTICQDCGAQLGEG